MDAPPKDQPNFQVKFGRFKTLYQAEKHKIKKKSKAESTHQATKVSVNCFNNYLIEKDLSDIENIQTDELPNILEDFYSEICKKKGESAEYKNSTVKCIRAGINRHFKSTRSLDIFVISTVFESKDKPTQMTKQSFTIVDFITYRKSIHLELICKDVHN